MGRAGLAAVVATVLVWAAPAHAQGPALPTNDFQGLLALTGSQTPAPLPFPHAQPPPAPVPEARCGAGSRPLAGMQGRVPRSAVESPEAARGWTCNVEVVGRHPTPGGFRVWRYVD